MDFEFLSKYYSHSVATESLSKEVVVKTTVYPFPFLFHDPEMTAFNRFLLLVSFMVTFKTKSYAYTFFLICQLWGIILTP